MSTGKVSLSELMDWIEGQEDIVVNFDDRSGVTLQVPSLMLRSEQHVHHGHYCNRMKRSGNASSCAQNKARSIERASKRRDQFSGHCPYGVWDLAQPVHFEDQFLGVFYLGSLASDDKELAFINGKKYSGPKLAEANAARKEVCSRLAQYLAQHMQLLLAQHYRDGKRLQKKRDSEFYAESLERYVETHFTRDVDLRDFARQLQVHENYLGSLIKDLTGKSFRQHIVDKRLAYAKMLLRAGNQSITEIAYTCGFHDSNYFSTCFKKVEGFTPRAYRKSVDSDA